MDNSSENQSNIQQLPLRPAVPTAARDGDEGGVCAGRELADSVACRHHYSPWTLSALLSTLAARTKHLRRMVVSRLVPRAAAKRVASVDRPAWGVLAIEALDCAADLVDRLFVPVFAVVLGVVALWTAVEFVLGISWLAAATCGQMNL